MSILNALIGVRFFKKRNAPFSDQIEAVFVSLFLFNDKLCVGKIDLVNE
ncbi:hypothetical protein C2W59_02300 [Bacillus pumilus]|nr:hypothetical protein C2W59_02300 [Bacillus pumilus]